MVLSSERRLELTAHDLRDADNEVVSATESGAIVHVRLAAETAWRQLYVYPTESSTTGRLETSGRLACDTEQHSLNLNSSRSFHQDALNAFNSKQLNI